MTAESNQGGTHHQGSGTEESDDVRFGYLLAVLILLVILYPFHEETPFYILGFAALNTVILAAAAYAASHSRRTLLIMFALSAPLILLEWTYAFYRMSFVGNFRYLAVAVFYGFTIYNVLRAVLRPGPVSADKISGAIAAYMLTAIGWAGLYGLTDSLVPGSFDILGHSDAGSPLSVRDLMYFSFTTLTTTGYGDITPVSRHAQSLAILEQMFGTFYVAILIARLAGLYQPGATKPSPHWRSWIRRPTDKRRE